MNDIKSKFKKRIWLASLGNGFIIASFTSFSNHAERGYISLGIGIIALLYVYIKPLKPEK